MNRRITSFFAALLALAAAASAGSCGLAGAVSGTDPALGWEPHPVPPGLTLRLLEGPLVRLDEPDVTFILNFWASWCAPCLVELPELQELERLMRDREDVRVIAVNTERHSLEWLSAFRERNGLHDLTLAPFDPEVVAAVRLDVVPLTVVVRDGRMVERHDGYRTTLVDELAERHAGRPLPEPDRKPVAF